MTTSHPRNPRVFEGGQRTLFFSLVWFGGLFLAFMAVPFFGDGGTSDALAAEPVQEVEVTLSEFTIQPTSFAFEAGDRVTFVIENGGQLAHEFRLTTGSGATAHAAGGHEGHDDTSGGTSEEGDIWVLINPGQTGTLDVVFDEHSTFDLAACLLPGHFEEGMTSSFSLTGVMAHADDADDHATDDHTDDHATDDDHPDAAVVDREVLIFMDEFSFDPDGIEVARGETIRFTIINAGDLRHEFRFTTEHAALEHVAGGGDDHHSGGEGDLVVPVEPGAAGTLVVTFDHDVAFDTLACFLENHYQSGLSAPLTITP